jgi:hypothetical protein
LGGKIHVSYCVVNREKNRSARRKTKQNPKKRNQ